MRSAKLFFIALVLATSAASAVAQVTAPRESNRQDITQIVGDTAISVSYHRPNTKGRVIWGELVPYNEVWRTGANDATVFEVSNDVMINGQRLPKGKYSLHTIPTSGDWTIIFNKTWNQWGSFNYDAKQDALRVTATPKKTHAHETMTIEFEKVMDNKAEMYIKWADLAVPVLIDVGDFNARFVSENLRRTRTERVQLASYILNQRLESSYPDALMWVEDAEKASATFGVLSLKARLLHAMGRKADAITTGERAVQVGKATTPAANTAGLENQIREWKASN